MGEEPKKDEAAAGADAAVADPAKKDEKKSRKNKKGEKEAKEEKPVYKDKEGNIVYHTDGRPMEIGPNGEPVAPPPLTEVQQIYLKIENTIDDVKMNFRLSLFICLIPREAGY
jgi:hypothetical protein